MLFDWLVTGQVMGVNPAASVRGPSHIVKRGKTPVLDLIEARALIDAIDVSMPIGLRDRALIGLMVYSFARIGDALIVLIDHLPREALTPSEAKAIHELKVMLKEIQKIKLGHNRPAFGPKKD
jgi:site-specific recombinase XerC